MDAGTDNIPALSPEPDLQSIVTRAIGGDGLSMAFQPIASLRAGDVAGHEALSRFDGDATGPGTLFDAASRMGRLGELEAAARELALDAAATWPDETLLFLNHSPPVIAEEDFVDSIAGAISMRGVLEPHRVVLEFTERADIGDLSILNRRIAALRELGIQVALDDVGAGISGLNRIMALRPDWVKLDRDLIADIDGDPVKQNLLRSLVRFARMSNMRLIAEGIERFEELAMVMRLGVTYGQGFYLARPAFERPGIEPEVCESIRALQLRTDTGRPNDPAGPALSGLVQSVVVADLATPVIEVADALERPDHPEAVALLDGRRYAGVVSRAQVLSFWRRTGGGEPPIATLDRQAGSVITDDITLAEALEVAASRCEERIGEPLIVQQEGRVIGMVSLRSLLDAAASSRRRLPSHVAALTGLPGRVQADQWLSARIRGADPVNIGFVDLRGFAAFNAAYGVDVGDTMLLRLVSLIQSVVGTIDSDVFIAHLGEDRFLAASRSDLSGHLQSLVREFDMVRSEFFSAREIDAGVFGYTDATGGLREASLTTVRVVYLERPLQDAASPRDLHEHVVRLRAAVRARESDPLIRERRRRAANRRGAA